ncbi:MAG: bifunctional diaminohydroxyphosphoribosylaminopyrimidine deaminase/5-amino-6-(5-phosphoribosylamino)uracil reductase RibD [Tannerella sp.]|jgi:diaminohydroxyphosphoribosylaminopyrimidine deaminase/5-amino-6-(5-phosphoribosylamino)uracil reductase|nr:bifunctional diaminohydroxyphosphoribosylaminopyrimidine deaminase/5-amino-6-(5-phosphoribosylamino)uracil reductase RibD [Tannerella sp.]
MQIDEKFMVRCLELAAHGRATVAPNPMVGAVVVSGGKIVGEGFHRRYGEAHAEVNAIAAVRDEALLHDATLYVNLEPCSHYGKTPPCARLIIERRIPRVVVGCLDPFPEVSGRGVAMLREAGIEVATGVLEREAKELNKIFLTAFTRARPYIILKWAESADGFLDRHRSSAAEPPVKLSSPHTRRMVHKLRTETAAILLGTNTVRLDDPSLTVRHWAGEAPVRAFIDRRLSIPATCRVYDGSTATLVFTEETKTPDAKAEYIRIDFSKDIVPQIVDALYQRRLYSLLVEGGAKLHRSFLDAGLWDEIQTETTPHIIGDGVKAVDLQPYISSNTENIIINAKKSDKSVIRHYSRLNF